MGPVPAGEAAPLPTLALCEVGALEHVDSGRVLQRRWWLPGWHVRDYTQKGFRIVLSGC